MAFCRILYCLVFVTYSEVLAWNRNRTNKTSKMTGFIVGGGKTDIDRFPHAVCLFHTPQRFFCGSSVLNERILLTAAHCLDGKTFAMDAYAGNANVREANIIRKVENFVMHEEYDRDTTENDIALLFLEESLPFGDQVHIKRAIISPHFPLDVTYAYVTGWGSVNDITKERSDLLKVTKQNIIPLQECEENYYIWWMPGMLCGGSPNDTRHRPSTGDSGGGLITKDYQLIGVVSFTMSQHPGLVFYTNISYFYYWIRKRAKDFCRTNSDRRISLPRLLNGSVRLAKYVNKQSSLKYTKVNMRQVRTSFQNG